ncbi:hypothetical protein LX64_01411 [Chitinophaga skermanii]|uniref:Natural product n=1 Tax=Chitinophaga skermanii TaxID=331697 RepID=A0A327R4E4_9BACT|nr:class I lanthipeptide [Chitinophaga skermanii]RAJ08757.1 hypothetical protein LX64_01411 [Chitinophaga skermanii]
MKKKKLALRKLSFEKTVVADLNKSEQANVQGGIATFGTRCETYYETCQTIPYTQMHCVPCLAGTL